MAYALGVPSIREIVSFEEPDPPEGADPWVRGGPSPMPASGVVAYDPAWPDLYESYALRIREAIGLRALVVEHVGSTAVPGLAAKPIIDIDLIVASPAAEETYVPALEGVGFEHRVREPWWYEHRMLRLADPLCHLHVFGPDAPEPWKHRILRDWLRSDAADRELYAQVKRDAAAESGAAGEHMMAYNARKQDVIREIYGRAFRAAGLVD